MTKSEAMNIEKTCDQILTNNTGCTCYCSMAMTGDLKIQFEGHYITISFKDLHTPVYLSFSGFWSDLEEFVNQVQKCIEDNRQLFERLMWSYDNWRELEIRINEKEDS